VYALVHIPWINCVNYLPEEKNAIETGDDRLEIFLKTLHDAPLKL